MLPEYIILDTNNLLRQLRQLSVGLERQEGKYFSEDITQDLLDCLRNLHTASSELLHFVKLFEGGGYEYGYTVLSREYATPVLELGLSVLNQLTLLGLYNAEGELLYYYRPIADPDFAEIILKRIDYLI